MGKGIEEQRTIREMQTIAEDIVELIKIEEERNYMKLVRCGVILPVRDEREIERLLV